VTVPEATDRTEQAGRWTDRAPASVLEFDLCALGDPDPTSQYLNETCGHHWHEWAGDEDIAAHRQCSWCSDVEWVEVSRG
jgi:hypothetical protein